MGRLIDVLAVTWESDKDDVLGESTPTPTAPWASRRAISPPTRTASPCPSRTRWAPQPRVPTSPVSTPPEATITAPEDGALVSASDVLAFAATVADAEDAATDLSLSWDMDGAVIDTTGADSAGAASFHALDGASTEGFTSGARVFTLTVTDTDGLFVTDSVTLSVNEPPTTPTVAITPTLP